VIVPLLVMHAVAGEALAPYAPAAYEAQAFDPDAGFVAPPRCLSPAEALEIVERASHTANFNPRPILDHWRGACGWHDPPLRRAIEQSAPASSLEPGRQAA
jgi:hypothetical protein